jgi:hypothetical protein
MSERDRLASREELCVLSVTVKVRTKCRKRGDRTRPLGPAICRSTAQTAKLVSSPRATCRASWLRVRTRVTTVTRLAAMYSHPIDGPTSITSFRSGNPRPRPDLRLTSLNRHNGLDCCSARGLSYRTIHGNRCAGGPSGTRLDGQYFRRSCRCIFAAKIAWDSAPISEDLRKSYGECRGNFFCALERRAPTIGATPPLMRLFCSASGRRLSCRLPLRSRHPGSGSCRRQSRPLRCRGVHRHSHPSGNAGPRRFG